MRTRLISIPILIAVSLLTTIGCGGGSSTAGPGPTPAPVASPTPTPVPSVTQESQSTAVDGTATFSTVGLQIQVTDLVSQQPLGGIEATLLQQGSQQGLFILDPSGRHAPNILLLSSSSPPVAGIRNQNAPSTTATNSVAISLTDTQFLTSADSTLPAFLTGGMWNALDPFYTCSDGPLSNVDAILESQGQDLVTAGVKQDIKTDVVLILDLLSPEIAAAVDAEFVVEEIGSVASAGTSDAALLIYQAKGYQPSDSFEICKVNSTGEQFLDHGFRLRPLQPPSGQPLFGDSVSGKVIDAATQQPLADATIRLAGPHPAEAFTAPDGTFHLTNALTFFSGNYSLSASLTGYIPSATQFTLGPGQAEIVNISLSKPAPATCVPAGAMAVLVHGSEVDAYVPDGSFQEIGTGVDFVSVEPPSTGLGFHIPTPNPVNSCSSNPFSGVTVCTANNTDVYRLSGTSLDSNILSSAGSGTLTTSGGQCTNCGVVVDPSSNRAVVGLSLANGTSTGYQILDLGSGTFDPPILMHSPGSPGPNISESFAVGVLSTPGGVQRLVLSPSEDIGASADYQIADISLPSSPQLYSFGGIGTMLTPFGEYDSAAMDCSTGVALATDEGTGNLFLADLTQMSVTGPSGTTPQIWNAPSQLQSLPEFGSFSAGTTAITIPPTSHVALLIDEFGTTGFGAVQLPSNSGTGIPTASDWVVGSLPLDPSGAGWSMPLDPHGLTGYISPSSGRAMGLIMNRQRTFLAVVDLQALLSAPRTGLHTLDPTVDLVANGVIRFVQIR